MSDRGLFPDLTFFERLKKYSKSFPFGKKKEMFEGPKIHDEFPHCRDVSCVFRGCETENHLIVTRHSLTPILEDFDSEPEKKNHIFVCQRNRPNSRKANDGREGKQNSHPLFPPSSQSFPITVHPDRKSHTPQSVIDTREIIPKGNIRASKQQQRNINRSEGRRWRRRRAVADALE